MAVCWLDCCSSINWYICSCLVIEHGFGQSYESGNRWARWGWWDGYGSAWLNGASFSGGLGIGLKAGAIGGVAGGVINGITSEIRWNRQLRPFKALMREHGLTVNESIPVTDEFLKKSQEIWFPDAPMENVKVFSVENLSEKAKEYFASGGADGLTNPLYERIGGELVATGKSNVYFNPNTAFVSARSLYGIMGHELIHVSQIGALTGQTSTFVNSVRNIMEFHAYNYQSQIGAGTIGNSFSRNEIIQMMKHDWYSKLSSNNFSWSFNHNFKYP